MRVFLLCALLATVAMVFVSEVRGHGYGGRGGGHGRPVFPGGKPEEGDLCLYRSSGCEDYGCSDQGEGYSCVCNAEDCAFQEYAGCSCVMSEEEIVTTPESEEEEPNVTEPIEPPPPPPDTTAK